MKLLNMVYLSVIVVPYLSCYCNDLEIQKYVIGNHGAGFFSCFNCTLNHLICCEENNKTPIVYWGENSQYYDPSGYNGSTNVWEYYFEPVSNLAYTEQDIIHFEPYPIAGFTIYSWTMNITDRLRVNQIIRKYVKIKTTIQKKIDDFYDKHMKGRRTIGIHLRGTDKYYEEPPVPLDSIIDKANELADANTQFYIASDDQRLFDRAKKKLRGLVINYTVTRNSTDEYGWPGKHPQKALLGEEVLIEANLLSKCHIFLHTLSNV